ncbi:MAG: PKD domain-containing protein, partial [Bacteroidota bacterium]
RGLYKRLFSSFPYDERINDMGVAYKTTSDLLYGSTHDPQRSAALQLPDNIRGEAFLNQDGHYVYVMWTPTFEDLSENTSATYSFPSAMGITQLIKTSWDFSYGRSDQVSLGPDAIQLTARPIFLTDTLNRFPVAPTADFAISHQLGCTPMQVSFSDQSSTNTTEWEWHFPGGTPATSTDQHPSITYTQAGTYDVTLIAKNANGQDEITQQEVVVVDGQVPTADFTINIFDNVLTCTNTSSGATEYLWNMGTGETRTEPNPTITYPIPGFFEITLIASNGCGSDTIRKPITIRGGELAPIPAFTVDSRIGCAPFSVQFFDESSENTSRWFWTFNGGTP